MRLSAIAAFVALALTSSLAAAQAPGETMSFDRENPPGATVAQTETVSYRGQVITADALSFGLVLLGPMAQKPRVSVWGVSGYFLGAPLVHIAHGRGTQALQSAALRVGLPLAGGLIGYHVGPSDTACYTAGAPDPQGHGGGCGDSGSLVGMLLGVAAGGISAMVIDATYLTHYERARTAPSWSASLQPTHGGASIGVAGMF